MKKKTIIITGAIAVAAIIIIIVLFSRAASRKGISNLFAESKRGQFDVVVTTTGELQAENSVDIMGPDFTQARNIRMQDIRIQDLVPEGTEVQVGDYIATLDRTSFDNTLRDEQERLITYETNLETAILDTSVNLSGLRDNIKNLTFNVEEAQITLDQSIYEPPTAQRQAEMALDRAKRSLDQELRRYELRIEQEKSRMRNANKQFTDQERRIEDIEKLLTQFIITAPSPGMVIYKRDRQGNKRRVGSSINPFDNVVATLPDMSSMLSKTYVNEIDVSKVKPGQTVEIMVDAFPEKSYTGVVLSVANIGEQLPNADAKVFETIIKVNESDLILKPSMTTGNKVVTQTITDVIYIPIECVQIDIDSIPFVYLKNGTKQIVVTGEANENHIIIEQGLKENTLVYLNVPEKPESFKLVGQDLIEVIRERERIKQEEEIRIRDNANRMVGPGGGRQNISPEMRERMQQLIESGDTAALRAMMPEGARIAPQGGGQRPGGGGQGTPRTQGGGQ